MKMILKDVKKNYGNVEALKGVSTEFDEGKFYGLLGPNGAGKTTLFSVLIQTIKQTSGSVEWQTDGRDIPVKRLYDHVGIVFQSDRLDDRLTVEENLVARGALYGLKKADVFRQVDIFDGYLSLAEVRKQKYGTLSGGQKRKVDIARALVHQPSVLLLDEPTTGLDPKSRNDLWKAICNLNKDANMTVVLITHYLEEMVFCDQLNVLIQGLLHYSGNIKDFINENSSTNLKITVKNPDLPLDNRFGLRVEWVGPREVVYYDTNMKEILDILADNRENIDDFEVKKATLESSYLNLISQFQGGDEK